MESGLFRPRSGIDPFSFLNRAQGWSKPDLSSMRALYKKMKN